MHNTTSPQITQTASAKKHFIAPTIMGAMTGAGVGIGQGSAIAVTALTDTPFGLAMAVTLPAAMILAIVGARLLTLRAEGRSA